MTWLAGDYDDLSEKTKLAFKEKFNNIMKTLFNDFVEGNLKFKFIWFAY